VAFRAKADDFPNLTVKKIPQAVLARCEWGKDDYSLNVDRAGRLSSPSDEPKAEATSTRVRSGTKADKASEARRKKPARCKQLPLFAGAKKEKGESDEPPRQHHHRPSQPSSPAAEVARDPERVMEIAQPHKGERSRGASARASSGEFGVGGGLRARLPEPVLRARDGRRQDAAHGGVHRLPAPGARGIRHFFVLAPNLTIYNKLLADFTPNTPEVRLPGDRRVRGEEPDAGDRRQLRRVPQVMAPRSSGDDVVINIFNIAKFGVRAPTRGKSRKARQLSEFLGQSYFDYLAGRRTSCSSWTRRIATAPTRHAGDRGAEARCSALELTATPQVESGSGPTRFKNIIYDYPLAKAMQRRLREGAGRRDARELQRRSMSKEQLER
jgi:hypothetical protein